MRYELKYYVKRSKLPLARKIVTSKQRLDPNVDELDKHYTVRSIYFDSIDLQHYNEKITGMKHRKKVRLRGYNYNPNSDVFFEIKRKYEEPSIKNRFSIHYDKAIDIILGNMEVPDDDNVKKFMYQLKRNKLRPMVNVIYDREPYVEPYKTPNNLRITFDKNLRNIAYPEVDELFLDKNLKRSMHDFFIMEIKFNITMPNWVREFIEAMSMVRESASKYVISMDNHPAIVKNSRFTYLRAKQIY